jgi:hypothetical protein
MREMGEKGLPRPKGLGYLHSPFPVKMRRMGSLPSRIQNKNFHTLQSPPSLLGNLANISNISKVSHPKTQHRKPTVKDLKESHLHSGKQESLRDRMELIRRQSSSFLAGGNKRIPKDSLDIIKNGGLSEKGHGFPHQFVESPDVV